MTTSGRRCLTWSALATAIGTIRVAYEGALPSFLSRDPAPAFCAWVAATARADLVYAKTPPPALAALLRAVIDRQESYAGPLDLTALSAFQRRVLAAVRAIPKGSVRTYGQIAAAIGQPRAARAVGSALARNPLPFVIPCHRVIAHGGRLGQYSDGGPTMKRRLLLREGVDLAL